jgi:hypothetical protein
MKRFFDWIKTLTGFLFSVGVVFNGIIILLVFWNGSYEKGVVFLCLMIPFIGAFISRCWDSKKENKLLEKKHSDLKKKVAYKIINDRSSLLDEDNGSQTEDKRAVTKIGFKITKNVEIPSEGSISANKFSVNEKNSEKTVSWYVELELPILVYGRDKKIEGLSMVSKDTNFDETEAINILIKKHIEYCVEVKESVKEGKVVIDSNLSLCGASILA